MSKPVTDPLTPAQIEALAETLDYWAERHPARLVPILGFGFFGLALSPAEIASSVAERARGSEDETSEAILRMVQFATEVKPFEEILVELRAAADGTELPGEVPG